MPARICFAVASGFEMLDLSGPPGAFNLVTRLHGADDETAFSASSGRVESSAGLPLCTDGIVAAIIPDRSKLLEEADQGGPLARRLVPVALPPRFGRFDAPSLAPMLVALLAGVAVPEARWQGWPTLAGAGQGLRLVRWRGWRVWRSALLFMPHLAYVFVRAGLIAPGLTVWGMLPAVVGLHLLRIGAIGGMTPALMRASSGHAGRGLQAGPALTAAFVSLALAALARVAVPFEPGLRPAAALRACGFAIFLARLTPVLTSPKPARRVPNPRPR